MLRADRMMRAVDRPFELRPEAFDLVGVNAPAHVLPGAVIDSAMPPNLPDRNFLGRSSVCHDPFCIAILVAPKFPTMKKNPNQIQQGDVLARVVASLLAGCKRLKTKTVALGEHTGHHHSFNSDGGIALMEAPNGVRFAVNEGTQVEPLTHQEHNRVVLQPGQIVEIGGVREKDWFLDMVRPVVD